MAGYWNQPTATAETIRGGWLRTGDMGSFDADGKLTLRDRSKDVIISGGSNIYPREVEEVLTTYPGITEVASSEWSTRSGVNPWSHLSFAMLADNRRRPNWTPIVLAISHVSSDPSGMSL